MTAFLTENHVEESAIAWLAELGYTPAWGPDLEPDGCAPERGSYQDVILKKRLWDAISRLNPGLTTDNVDIAVAHILRDEKPSLLEENRRLHGLLTDGLSLEVKRDDGTLGGEIVRLLDFDNPTNNDWLAVRQFTVIQGERNRRADVALFINGLPLAVLELKNPGIAGATLSAAIQQLQTYKLQISSLFRTNALLVASDGITARLGSLTADEERFMPWRTVDGKDIAPKGSLELETLLRGVFAPHSFLQLLRSFTVFQPGKNGLIKIIAGYHQFHAVLKALEQTVSATSADGSRKVGVIWHTQGSGKSLLMAFYAGLAAKHPVLANPTLVVITDRNDLDDQLFQTFGNSIDLLRQTPQQAENRENLRELLTRKTGGIIFTTLQKFTPDEGASSFPLLTDRRNVIVVADEAHRSQYGFKAKVGVKTGEISYGLAKYLRDALPNASFIGFTGTPVEQGDVNTPAVFGEYIDVYDISRAVEDGATVPIYYESRLARIALDEEERPHIDDEMAALTEDDAIDEAERLKRKWAQVEALVGAEDRLALIAQDLVEHFENRVQAMNGKAMAVCMSRRICIALYDAITKLRPNWHDADPAKGKIKIVMTGAATDPLEWQAYIGNKARREQLAKRFKDPDDPLSLVLVRDMWLTGFDAPSLHTLYVDKPMQGHGLMQAIARVNRVYHDKPAGLVVDYIGLAQDLKKALSQYSPSDQERTGVDEAQAVAVLQEKFDIVRGMLHGFEYQSALVGTPHDRLFALAGAMNWILEKLELTATQEQDEEARKKIRRRFDDAVLALTKAFALAAASDYARSIREEVGFFQAVRIAMSKPAPGSGQISQDRDFAVRQLVSRAVISTEIIDILKVAGIETPDISILSEDFLKEVRQLPQKNLALEALRKLLQGEIRSHGRTSVVEQKKFTERLDDAINRYHSNSMSTVQMIDELISMAKDLRDARQRGEELGLSKEEQAFYTALAENESAVEAMGDAKLRLIAHELLESLRKNRPVDWTIREQARARMRVLVKRILRHYGYPPDLQDAAVRTVLQQAEVILTQISA